MYKNDIIRYFGVSAYWGVIHQFTPDFRRFAQ